MAYAFNNETHNREERKRTTNERVSHHFSIYIIYIYSWFGVERGACECNISMKPSFARVRISFIRAKQYVYIYNIIIILRAKQSFCK